MNKHDLGQKTLSASLQWARRCYFGTYDENPVVAWQQSSDMDIAIGALNATLFGLVSRLGFRFDPCANHSSFPVLDSMDSPRITWATSLEYRIELPGYDPQKSGYAFSLQVIRLNGKTPVLAANQHNADKLAEVTAPAIASNYTIESARQPTATESVIAGGILLDLFKRDIAKAILRIRYWPDYRDVDAFAEVTIEEEY